MINGRKNDLTREDLGRLGGISKRAIRAFEELDFSQSTISEIVSGLQGAPVIGVTLSDAFTNDRVLVGSSDILITDGGPKGNLTVSLTPSGVSAATYGGPAFFTSFAVNSRGRITLAAQYAAITTNVAEGSNLYFTVTRTRGALSGGAGVVYTPATGVIALNGVLTALSGLNATAGLIEQTGAATFTKRSIGISDASSILTRADGDGRYMALNGAVYSKASATSSAAFTPAADDYFVRIDASAAPVTVTLPAATTGRVLVFKKVDASTNAVVLDPSGSATIDGVATYAFDAPMQAIMVQTDGSNWWII